jgi:hypothetical protein
VGYSRRFRFGDGKSLLHRVEYAQEFDTRLRARTDVAHNREAPAEDAPRAAPAQPGPAGTGRVAPPARMPPADEAAGRGRPSRPRL